MKGLRNAVIFSLICASAKCQDISNFTQFFLNPYTLNPSYAGIEGRSAFFAAYRKQWTTVEGGPVLANLTYHTPLKNKINLGLNFNSDSRGITKTSSILVTGGYAIPLDKTSWIRFALSVGYGSNIVDINKLGTFNDPAFANLLSKNSFLLGNAGVSFHKKTFHGGIGLPYIFQPVYLSNDAFSVTALQPFRSVILHASNRFYFNNDKNIFEPYAIYRINNGLPAQFELAGVVHLENVVWVGASYKQQFGISALGGVTIKNMFAVGFSYSIKNSGVNQLASPSFEIQLGYVMGEKNKDVEVYSFVDTQKAKTHKKTNAELAAEHKKLLAAEAKKKEEEDQKKKLLAAKQKEEAEKKLREEELAKTTTPVVEDKTVGDVQHSDEQDKLKRLETHADNPTEEHNSEVVHPHAERHEFVKRGGHQEELALGNYVILGVFRSRHNAENFNKGLTAMSFASDFGFLSANGLWYVHLAETDDINEARAERDRYRKMKIARDAWLLTVHQ